MDEEVKAENYGLNRLVVAVRIRPLNQKELAKENLAIIARCIDEHTVLINDPSEDYLDILRKDRHRDRFYGFDYAFPPSATQHDVFEKTTKTLVDSVIQGINSTVFAYGATGAGKTHTMMGTDSEPGIMSLTMIDLFEKIKQQDETTEGTFDISLTYLEIYNENIRDLLSGKPEYLDLRDDGNKGIVVSGIVSVKVTTTEQVLDYLKKGNKYRTSEATGANQVSSRSHAVLQINVSYKSVNPNGHTIERFAKLSMIDLAGSERAAETKNRGIRMIEGANINRSLLALGNCITALGNDKMGPRGKYVNYRDSKLTRLLKDSLGGNCRTVMIANISPASSYFEETHNTLKYASRARLIKTKISPQVIYKYDPYNAAVMYLQNEIGELKSKLQNRGMSRSPSGIPATPIKDLKRLDDDTSSIVSSIHTSHMDHIPPAVDAADAVSFAEVEEYERALEKLFREQKSFQAKLLFIDDELAENSIKLRRKRNTILKLERIAKRESLDPSSLNVALKKEAEMRISKIKNEVENLKNLRTRFKSNRGTVSKQILEVDEKIRMIDQTIPKSIDRKGQKYLKLLIHSHTIEMQASTLKNTHTQYANLLRVQEEMNTKYARQVDLADQIYALHHHLLSEHKLLAHPSSQFSDLVHRYNKLCGATDKLEDRQGEEAMDVAQPKSSQGYDSGAEDASSESPRALTAIPEAHSHRPSVLVREEPPSIKSHSMQELPTKLPKPTEITAKQPSSSYDHLYTKLERVKKDQSKLSFSSLQSDSSLPVLPRKVKHSRQPSKLDTESILEGSNRRRKAPVAPSSLHRKAGVSELEKKRLSKGVSEVNAMDSATLKDKTVGIDSSSSSLSKP